jgi:hypothetical protein
MRQLHLSFAKRCRILVSCVLLMSYALGSHAHAQEKMIQKSIQPQNLENLPEHQEEGFYNRPPPHPLDKAPDLAAEVAGKVPKSDADAGKVANRPDN